MVLERGSIEGEGGDGGYGGEYEGGGWGGNGEEGAGQGGCRALQQILEDVAFTPAPPSSSAAACEPVDSQEGEEEQGLGLGQGMGQEQEQEQKGPIIHEIELSQSVVRWLEGADAVLLGMFYSRVQMLAGGRRSKAYCKRLVGTRVPMWETKLDGGVRILWTQLRRGVEKPAIIILFVAKHDRVPRCIELLGRCFRHRDWGQGKGQGMGQGQGVAGVYQGGKGCVEGEVVELEEDESLLDPVSNAPLKTYSTSLGALPALQAQAQAREHSGSGGSRGGKLPLRLSKRERDVNMVAGTVLLLGRSGTGKTVCLCNRMASDRQTNPVSSQLFVCRSRRLRDAVQRYQRDYGNLGGEGDGDEGDSGLGGGAQSRPESAFLTLDAFLDDMESRVLGAEADTVGAGAGTGADVATGAADTATRVAGGDGGGGNSGSKGVGGSFSSSIVGGRGRVRTFLPSKRVDFRRFQQLFSEFGRPKLDPLVAWTQIRSFIKGSVEALLGEGEGGSSGGSGSSSRALSLPAYLALSNKRCRLQSPERAEAYAVYLQYEALLLKGGMWDDCDRVMRILTTGLELTAGKRGWDGGDWGGGGCGFSAFDKVYVDEVQDSSQIEIALYFLAAGMRYDRLFLAGDPAQSIVEGIDFRFEEVRGIVHALSQRTVRIHSPVTLNTNYRCHAGILNCASGVLDLLLSTFPHAADKLPRDTGLCGGPRPEYFADTGTGAGAGAGAFLRRLLLHNPRIVVLCRDEQFRGEGDQGGHGQGESLGGELSTLVPEETLALGIRASKGMEFPDVLLLNFFCDLPASEQRAWKRRLIDGEKEGPNIPPQMETQLKLLYTAVTRSCARLIFAETRFSAAGDAFFRWLDRQQLAERMAIKREWGAHEKGGQGGEQVLGEGKEGEEEGEEERGYLSNDEWRTRGIQLAMSNSGPALRIAAKCFVRAGDKAHNLLSRVVAQEQVERAREGFSATLGDATTLTPTHESELAALVLRCVELQLYQDALDLCALLLPHLPGPSQALLRERVMGELWVFTAR
ncbi:P-loop containing nucleoside triphosphate hydrolase protein [Ochromonadaceae sp. CCMP2298]|nr:P-loop containing nucleoside triphosphate hydrolase protein [Ochromonadaceae sp. CCMP2298]